jgi:hypothetical protein
LDDSGKAPGVELGRSSGHDQVGDLLEDVENMFSFKFNPRADSMKSRDNVFVIPSIDDHHVWYLTRKIRNEE